MNNCLFCKLGSNDDSTFIEEYGLWIVRLSIEQHTLGSLQFILKEHKEGFENIPVNAFSELNSIILKYQKKIKKLFKADLFNYLLTNNIVRHFHVHCIPRYSKEIVFEGISFIDSNFGNMVEQKTKPIPENFLVKLKKAIKQ